MINTELARLESLVVHKSGNKLKEEGINISKGVTEVDDETSAGLLRYFLSPFEKVNEYFHFTHPEGLENNELYKLVAGIFDDPSTLYEQSVSITKQLYEVSEHPKIRNGELFVGYLTECVVDGQAVEAVGIFKCESRETFLKVKALKDNFRIESGEGININKLDKGCLIFNLDREKGFLVAVSDAAGRSPDARYWKDDFLRLKPKEDDFFHTKNVMGLCRDFVVNELPEKFELTRAEQADLLNKSVDFFKKNEEFTMEKFTDEIFPSAEVKETFKNYREQYAEEQDLEIADGFSISNNAVKKQARVFKSVIKLDKNFHIYVHGNREYIVKGFDPESGLSYYQLFFKEEV
jgi:hypothetical protein